MHEPHGRSRVGVVVGLNLRRRGTGNMQARLNQRAPELVGDYTSRNLDVRAIVPERSDISDPAPVEVETDHRLLGIEDRGGRDVRVRARDGARVGSGEGRLRVLGHPRDRRRDVPADRVAVDRAAGPLRKDQLAFGQVGVQRGPGLPRRVAELGVPSPEVDASVGRLVRVRLGGRPRRPAPRPDRAEPQLLRHRARREYLELRQLEPLARRLEVLMRERPAPSRNGGRSTARSSSRPGRRRT